MADKDALAATGMGTLESWHSWRRHGPERTDYGILMDGIRYESPDHAASAVHGDTSDGWTFWQAHTESGYRAVAELLELDPVARRR